MVRLWETGRYIKVEDYLAMQAALREALDGWESWAVYDQALQTLPDGISEEERIAALRKEFLDD